MPSNDTNHLTRAEVEFFVENGYLGPYAAMSPAEMAGFRAAIEAHVLDSDGPIRAARCNRATWISRPSMTWPRIPPSWPAGKMSWVSIATPAGCQIDDIM